MAFCKVIPQEEVKWISIFDLLPALYLYYYFSGQTPANKDYFLVKNSRRTLMWFFPLDIYAISNV